MNFITFCGMLHKILQSVLLSRSQIIFIVMYVWPNPGMKYGICTLFSVHHKNKDTFKFFVWLTYGRILHRFTSLALGWSYNCKIDPVEVMHATLRVMGKLNGSYITHWGESRVAEIGPTPMFNSFLRNYSYVFFNSPAAYSSSQLTRAHWRHQIETFSKLLDICAGNSPVNSPHKGQWRRALMFSLICAWINGWVNNGEAGDLKCHHAHYDVTVMANHGHKLSQCVAMRPYGITSMCYKELHIFAENRFSEVLVTLWSYLHSRIIAITSNHAF